jgi:hypothetical protein
VVATHRLRRKGSGAHHRAHHLAMAKGEFVIRADQRPTGVLRSIRERYAGSIVTGRRGAPAGWHVDCIRNADGSFALASPWKKRVYHVFSIYYPAPLRQ